MEKMINSINWVEIPVLNFDRAKEFYSRIYDFEMFESSMASGRMGFLPMEPQSQGIGGAIVQGKGYLPTSLGVKVYLNGGNDLNTVLTGSMLPVAKLLSTKQRSLTRSDILRCLKILKETTFLFIRKNKRNTGY